MSRTRSSGQYADFMLLLYEAVFPLRYFGEPSRLPGRQLWRLLHKSSGSRVVLVIRVRELADQAHGYRIGKHGEGTQEIDGGP